MSRLTYAKAVANADALKAIGQTSVYLSDLDEPEDGMPWEYVNEVTGGGLHSYIGPRSVAFKAVHPSGIEFRWTLDFSSSHLGSTESRPFFEHSRIVAMADRLSPSPRAQFAAYLKNEVLPPLEKNVGEARLHLNALLDGVTTLTGIIAATTP